MQIPLRIFEVEVEGGGGVDEGDRSDRRGT
jgi:hypothetical protein